MEIRFESLVECGNGGESADFANVFAEGVSKMDSFFKIRIVGEFGIIQKVLKQNFE